MTDAGEIGGRVALLLSYHMRRRKSSPLAQRRSSGVSIDDDSDDDVPKKHVPSTLHAPPAKRSLRHPAPFPPHSVDFALFEKYSRNCERFRKRWRDKIDNPEVDLTLIDDDDRGVPAHKVHVERTKSIWVYLFPIP
jgi:hypothetical protein